MKLRLLIDVLSKMFKLQLAETWDNVGLLIEPSSPHSVKRILLTNDLTESVLNEALTLNSDFIISYHPPLFHNFKRLTQGNWKERIAIRCIEKRIAVYSPHTALDAVKGGINDWLLSPFTFDSITPIWPCKYSPDSLFAIVKMDESYKKFCLKNKIVPIEVDIESDHGMLAKFAIPPCKQENLTSFLGDVSLIRKTMQPGCLMEEGSGRIANLRNHLTVSEIISAYKKLLDVNTLTIALGKDKSLSSRVSCIAVCAGSGGSVLFGQAISLSADLLLTGEASHHDKLDAVARGVTVITAGHSNTERGFLLQRLKPWLIEHLQELKSGSSTFEDVSVEVCVSTLDKEPDMFV